MFKNYLSITLRNLRKNRGYSFIVIFGLALSLSLSLIIIQMILGFYSYDRFHEDRGRIYRVNTTRSGEDRTQDFAPTPFPLASVIAWEIPGVETSTLWAWGIAGNAVCRDKVLPMSSLFADPNFFQVFSFKLRYGDPVSSLREPNSIVLSSNVASMFFEDDNPVGEVIRLGKWGDYTVTGVLEDTSHLKSHFQLRSLVSLSTLSSLEQQKLLSPRSEDWTRLQGSFTYVKLKPGVSHRQIQDTTNRLAQSHISDPKYKYRFWFQPLTGIVPGPDLSNSSGDSVPMGVIYILFAVALLVILSAAFNYTNLSTARALSRAREVGIRKVVGAQRRQIFAQFVGESIVLALLALGAAFVLYRVVLIPLFLNLHEDVRIFFSFRESLATLGYFLLFAVVTGIMAGAIPALHISRFKAVDVLRNLAGLRVVSRVSLRKALIVFQFALSVIFIISTLIAIDQVRFIQESDHGLRTDGLICLPLRGVDYGIFRQKAAQDSQVLEIAGMERMPGVSGQTGYTLTRRDAPVERMVRMVAADAGYVPLFGLQLLAGANFPEAASPSEETMMILNETAVRELQYSDPDDALGKSLVMKDGSEFRVAGVMKDFSHNSIADVQDAFALRFKPEECSYAVLRVRTGGIKEVASRLQRMWASFESAAPFEYDVFADLIQAELLGMKVMMKVIRFVSVLAIVIACLGMLGIADYSSRIRRREVGIRKVCGAGEWNLVVLLSRSFVAMMMIAAAAAVPVALWFNGILLSLHDRQVGMRAEHFIFGAGIVLALGMGMVLLQTVRAARTNPAEIIRHE